jgi:glycosyltransferase involved in cell wall biosynthesis
VTNNEAPGLAVVTGSFPPQVSGSGILLANLLADYRGNVTAIVARDCRRQTDPDFLSPCPTRPLKLASVLPRTFDRLRRRFPEAMSRLIAKELIRTLKALDTKVVMGVFPYDVFLVGAFIASRQLGMPFYAHLHDLWSDNAVGSRFAEYWEPRILKESTRVLCMTEAMQEYYKSKYGIPSELLPHTISLRDYSKAPASMVPPDMPRPTVLFVGSGSPQMNLDALQVLASASELLPANYDLLFCTDLDRAALNALGIRSSRLQARYVSRAEAQRLQSQADIVIAPLSHKNCSSDEVRTVFSTKLLEHLICGRPIVVFAPEDSYHAVSARNNGWGYVVAEDSPSALAAAIVKVANDEDLARSLVHSALEEARSRIATSHADRLQNWLREDAHYGNINPGLRARAVAV